LVKNYDIKGPGEVFVADITYIHLLLGHAYLFLITDAYSRMIVGYHLSDSLSHQGAQKALEMASQSVESTTGIIHHSDRGSQYCCHDFIDSLIESKMRSSMTDSNHAAQNALAERINGILKKEHGCGLEFPSFNDAKLTVDDGIYCYNYLNPHGSFDAGETPAEVHFGGDDSIEKWSFVLKKQMPEVNDQFRI
jgi:putative transposase